MRLLVLGKSGQVGWELQRSLAPLGVVIALGRDRADLENAAQLKSAIEAAAPDVIVNASAYTAVDKAESERERCDRINHRAVAEIAEIAAATGIWFVHYSTDYVFDGRKDGPYVETDETNPINAYGRTKRDGEIAIANSGAKHLIFRTSWVHAARGSNFIRSILRLARERTSLRIVADQLGAPTSAEFIADATAHAIRAVVGGDASASGIYHLTSAGATSWHGLATHVVNEALRLGADLKCAPGDIAAIGTVDFPTPARRPINSRLDGSHLAQTFGISRPDWTQGAERTVAESFGTASR